MPKRSKIDDMATVLYDGEIYGLTGPEYSQYEQRLEELNNYKTEDVDLKTDWITYQSLEDSGYPVLKPRQPEPLPSSNIFDLGRAEDVAFEVKDTKYRESQKYQKLQMSDDFEALAAALPKRTRNRFASNSSHAAEQRRIKRIADAEEQKKLAQRGGAIIMSIIALILLALLIAVKA